METVFYYINNTEIELPVAMLESIPTRGRCDDACYDAREEYIEVFKDIPDSEMRDHLYNFGAWDDNELKDRDANIERIIWIASGDYFDGYLTDKN